MEGDSDSNRQDNNNRMEVEIIDENIVPVVVQERAPGHELIPPPAGPSSVPGEPLPVPAVLSPTHWPNTVWPDPTIMRVSIRYPGLGSVDSSNSSSVNQYYGEVSGGSALPSAGSSLSSSGSFGPGSGRAGESIDSTLTFPRRVGEVNQSMSPPSPPPPSPRSQPSFGGPGSTTSPRRSTRSSGPVGSGSGTGPGTGTGPGPGPRFSTGASGGPETPLRKRRRCSYAGSSGSSSGNGSGSGPSNSSGTGLRNSVNSHSHPNRVSWQETMSSMSERIRHNFNRPDMSDITFLVGQDKTPIYAHKTLLCFSSPVFQAQFVGSLSNQASTEEIPDIQADVFLNFLSFLYCETFDEEMDVKQLLDLLYPATKYLVPSLTERCVSELIEKLKPNNIFSVYEGAVLYDELMLKKQCIKYMERMSDKIIQTEEFKTIKIPTLSIFLALDGLNSPECHLHRALLGWAEAECVRQEQIITKDTIRRILGPSMYMIRFPTMSAPEFSKEFPDSVLTDEESVIIYRQICSQPTWQPEISHFPTQKRIFSPTSYTVNRFVRDDSLIEPHQVNIRNGHLYTLDIEFFTDKRIFMDGLSLFTLGKTHAGGNGSLGFEVGVRVCRVSSRSFPEHTAEARARQLSVIGDLTSRSNNSSPLSSSNGRLSRAVSSHYFPVYLDEPLEIPSGQKVIVHVSVSKADSIHTTNFNTFYGTTGAFHMPPNYTVPVDCEDGRMVTFTFGNKVISELGVYSFGQIPEILFSL